MASLDPVSMDESSKKAWVVSRDPWRVRARFGLISKIDLLLLATFPRRLQHGNFPI